jgi:hypothetical protein
MSLCWTALAAPSAALANGRFPAANRIVLSPTDPNLVVVRTTYGILVSSDHGGSWAFICEDVLGLPQTAPEDPALALTANGSLVAGVVKPAGLDVSADRGCNWSCIGGALANQGIADLAVRPEDAHTVVALTSTFFSGEGGSGTMSQVFRTSDDGANWSPLGIPLDTAAVVTTIEVAPSDPHRLYVSATRGYGPSRTASLFVSYDDGATWVERAAPLDTSVETAVFIAGVDPIDADRVYLRTNGVSRLLITTDAGQSFQVGLKLISQMLGFALSPDGSQIYLGGVEDGLFVGDRATSTFVQRSSAVPGRDGGPVNVHVQCLAAHGSELWACADDPSGFIAAVSMDQGATFTPKLQLGGVGAPIACGVAPESLACGADAGGGACSGMPFTQLCANLGCAPDAGADASATTVGDARPDSVSENDAGPAPARGSSCGCIVGALGRNPVPGVVFAALALGAGAARRRGRRPEPVHVMGKAH